VSRGSEYVLLVEFRGRCCKLTEKRAKFQELKELVMYARKGWETFTKLSLRCWGGGELHGAMQGYTYKSSVAGRKSAWWLGANYIA
jgi:hypothetical protein